MWNALLQILLDAQRWWDSLACWNSASSDFWWRHLSQGLHRQDRSCSWCNSRDCCWLQSSRSGRKILRLLPTSNWQDQVRSQSWLWYHLRQAWVGSSCRYGSCQKYDEASIRLVSGLDGRSGVSCRWQRGRNGWWVARPASRAAQAWGAHGRRWELQAQRLDAEHDQHWR